MKNFLKEFKEFITKGNVLELAIGVIIGTAFSKIVSSLVDNILMPLFGILVGGIDFTNLSISVGNSVLQYGVFVQNVINFLIIAFCIFIFVRAINKFNRRFNKKERPKAEPKKEEILLEEIRDILKEK